MPTLPDPLWNQELSVNVSPALPTPVPAGHEVASAMLGTNGEIQKLPVEQAEGTPSERLEIEPRPLSWLPQTLAAVALRLYSLDANLRYTDSEAAEREVLLVRLYHLLSDVSNPV